MINALYDAFSAPEQELRTEHLLKAAREIIPLVRSRAREIEALRQWATTHCLWPPPRKALHRARKPTASPVAARGWWICEWGDGFRCAQPILRDGDPCRMG